MKRLKKFISLLSVVALLAMNFTISVFADNPTGSITLNNDKEYTNVSIVGKTYSAYKIFDLVQNSNHTTYAYTLATEFEELFEDTAFTTAFPTATVNGDSTESIYEFVSLLNTEDTEKFANCVNDFVKSHNITPTKTATANIVSGTKEAATFTELPLGYYLIYGTAASLDNNSNVVTACVLDTTTYDDTEDAYKLSIDVKVGVPTVEKKIIDSNLNKVDADSASIGETVNFKVTSEVPDLTGYTAYSLIMTDTMSKGLTYNNDMVVKIGTTTIASTNYSTTLSTDTVTGVTTIKIEFNDFYKLAKGTYNYGTEITYSYSAKVNKYAVIGSAGNPNSAKITYSNNPNDTKTNDTPNDTVKVYTFKYNVFKYTMNVTTKAPLSGAKFELRKNAADASAINFIEVSAGNYRVATAEEIADSTIEKVTTIVSQDDGNLNITGLGKGTYYLKETKAPDGYNLLEADIVVNITPVYNETDKTELDSLATPVTGAKYTNIEDKSGIKSEIENTTGVELPSTGGMGTTILYIIGGLFIAIATIGFTTKKLAKRA